MQSKLGCEEMTWRNAALALGETLSPSGPDRYYEYSPDVWLGWAKLMTKNPCYRCPRCGTGMQPDPSAKHATAFGYGANMAASVKRLEVLGAAIESGQYALETKSVSLDKFKAMYEPAATNLSQSQYDQLVRDAMAYRASMPETEACLLTRSEIAEHGHGRAGGFVEEIFFRKLERQKALLMKALQDLEDAASFAPEHPDAERETTLRLAVTDARGILKECK